MTVIAGDRPYRPNVECVGPEGLAPMTPWAVVPAVANQYQYMSGNVASELLGATLNGWGKEGWQLRVCVSNRTATGYLDGTYFVILERKLTPADNDREDRSNGARGAAASRDAR